MRILGRKFGLRMYDGSTYRVVGAATNCALNVNSDMVELASASSVAKAYAAGRYGYTVTVDMLYDVTGSGDLQTYLLRSQLSGEMLYFMMGDDGGKVTYSGECYVSSFAATGDVNGYATVSVTMQGTGELSVN